MITLIGILKTAKLLRRLWTLLVWKGLLKEEDMEPLSSRIDDGFRRLNFPFPQSH